MFAFVAITYTFWPQVICFAMGNKFIKEKKCCRMSLKGCSVVHKKLIEYNLDFVMRIYQTRDQH